MLHPLGHVRDHQNPLADPPVLASCQNTSFAIVWPMRMARIEHAWSTGFRRYIINASSAAGAEVRRVFEANFDRRACHHVALLTPEALLRVGRRPSAKVLDLKGRFRCRGCGRKGRAV